MAEQKKNSSQSLVLTRKKSPKPKFINKKNKQLINKQKKRPIKRSNPKPHDRQFYGHNQKRIKKYDLSKDKQTVDSTISKITKKDPDYRRIKNRRQSRNNRHKKVRDAVGKRLDNKKGNFQSY